MGGRNTLMIRYLTHQITITTTTLPPVNTFKILTMGVFNAKDNVSTHPLERFNLDSNNNTNSNNNNTNNSSNSSNNNGSKNNNNIDDNNIEDNNINDDNNNNNFSLRSRKKSIATNKNYCSIK
jgi:hypothetical protein